MIWHRPISSVRGCAASRFRPCAAWRAAQARWCAWAGSISIDRAEYLDGVNAVSTPIYGVGGALVALLWIVGFASRLKDEILERAAGQLRKEAMTISQALGAKPG